MPPLPVIPNAVKCSLKWVVGGQSAMISFGVSTTLTDLAAVAAAITSRVTAPMWGTVTGLASATEMHLFRYDGVTPTFVQALTGAQWVGGAGASDQMSPASAVVVSFRTAARGQWARGRLFLPFTGESAMSGGGATPATVTTMQTAWDSFRTGMTAGGTALGVISLANHPELNPPHTPSIRLVISSTVEGLLGTQRRRQGRLR